jgi:hypothetical protein
MKKREDINSSPKPGSRVKDYPELQVGFPERNECTPVDDMERIHVDLETMDISRKNLQEFTKEITESNSK